MNKVEALTAKDWILSILGIIILLCFIILPPVFRTFLKDEVKLPEPTTYPVVTLNCYKDNITYDDYTDKVNFTFYSQNAKISSYSKKIERVYSDEIIYQQEKLNYGKLVTAFSVINGYQYLVTPNDDLFSLIINEDYDLNKFQDTKIMIPGDDDTTEVKSDYYLNDNIDSIKESLINDSYICSE